MNILIVDDEAVSRVKMEAILEEFGECRAVASGPEAISAVQKALAEKAPYDLITMDISMPEMDGTEALYEIRNLERSAYSTLTHKARIIMVTAQADRDSLITCVQAGCDDYIIKPFDPDTVIQRLKSLKIPALEKIQPKTSTTPAPESSPKNSDKVAIGREVMSLFKRGEINLPSPPGIYRKFRHMVDQGADVNSIADLLKEDVGISFHLISISNSPHYRGVKENRNLQQAIGRLGLNLTKKYVDILGNRNMFTTGNMAYQSFMHSLWEHSVACANASEILTRALGIHLDHDPFTLGILHDVGKMVIIQILGELEARGKISPDMDRADIIGTLEVHHGSFGQAVLNQWNFPKEFGMIAKWHDNLEESPGDSVPLSVVQLSNLITQSLGYGYDRPLNVDLLNNPAAKKLGITNDLLEKAVNRLVEVMDETRKALETNRPD